MGFGGFFSGSGRYGMAYRGPGFGMELGLVPNSTAFKRARDQGGFSNDFFRFILITVGPYPSFYIQIRGRDGGWVGWARLGRYSSEFLTVRPRMFGTVG